MKNAQGKRDPVPVSVLNADDGKSSAKSCEKRADDQNKSGHPEIKKANLGEEEMVAPRRPMIDDGNCALDFETEIDC